MKCLCPIKLPLYDKRGDIRKGFKPHAVILTSSEGYHVFDGYIVPCGQCIACRLNYAKFWSIRMMQELKKHDAACFATLTYDGEHYEELLDDQGIARLCKKDLQDFWKRLRKKRSVRYFCCGEYGDQFGRPHYHAIIYGVSPQEHDLIEESWQNGQVKLGTVTPDSCNYVAKYMTKKLRGKSLEAKLSEDPDFQNEFVLMSRRPGIGGDLDDDMVNFIKETGFIYRKGFRSALPRYYKEKYDIHSDDLDIQDEDEIYNRLTNYDKLDKIIRKEIDFYRRK